MEKENNMTTAHAIKILEKEGLEVKFENGAYRVIAYKDMESVMNRNSLVQLAQDFEYVNRD